MPAIQPYIIEPIFEQFEALLPEREADHPLGCHRPRIPDRVVFEKLVQVLVFGCAYWRIADGLCSATTLRRRRDEWIEAGVMDDLEEVAREAYDRSIGLELSDVAVDCCITKAPCGGEKAGKSPVDRGKQGLKRSTMVDGEGIPLARGVGSPGQPPRLLAAVGPHPGCSEGAGRAAGAGERPPRSGLRLERRRPPALGGTRAGGRDLQERRPRPSRDDETMGRRTNQLLAKRPQEAPLVYRARGAGHRLLDRLFQRDHHRGQAYPRSLDPLPLGRPAYPPAVTYWRKL